MYSLILTNILCLDKLGGPLTQPPCLRTFDITLLEAGGPDIQRGALERLRTWLGIMEEVRSTLY